MKYAANTSVSSEASKAEIERTLRRFEDFDYRVHSKGPWFGEVA